VNEPAPRRVVILGGGIAGLAAAWELSRPEHREHIGSITVYQRGWRLGGKGASSRGEHGRIEEHGLHVWLGYYENAFRLVRECYAELDRPRTDPNSPIREWTDGFVRASHIGLGERHADTWRPWVASFAEDDDTPGDLAADRAPMTVAELVRRAISLLRDLAGSLPPRRAQTPDRALTLSADPEPPDPTTFAGRAAAELMGDGMLLALVIALELAAAGSAAAGSAAGAALVPDDRLRSFARASLDPLVDRLRREVEARVHDDDAGRQVWHLVDLISATLRGVAADNLLTDPAGFAAIDDWDYRDWIAHHGASAETQDSPLVRGVYDLVFGYEHGDERRPRFAAGTGLLLSAKLFFDYRGAIFWKMTAGMGEVVFAPLYEALVRRGVRFEFFHRVDGLRVGNDGTGIDAIDLGVQVALRDGETPYDPLVRVSGLGCWPASPRREQLAEGEQTSLDDLESHWSQHVDAGTRTLRRGDDYDAVVLAIPVGMHRHVCSELIENPRTPAWRAMVEGLGTVATQTMQLWLTVEETELTSRESGLTVSGFPGAFHTCASMSHLLAVEGWEGDDRPASVLYFCHTREDRGEPPPARDVAYPVRELARLREDAADFLRHDVRHGLAAMAASGDDFRWNLLFDDRDATGEQRLDAQYLRANVDPSDRYVLSLPGTGRLRLRADESGYDNLVLAGDWVDSGLNAGCIEAAVMSGIQAGNALTGRPLLHGIAGYFLPHHGRAGRPWTGRPWTEPEPRRPLAFSARPLGHERDDLAEE
jgi:uncharacterized protein with NAD-binding domain and iron-sulfur cluster